MTTKTTQEKILNTAILVFNEYGTGPYRAVGRNFQNSCWPNGRKRKALLPDKKFRNAIRLIRDRPRFSD